MKVTAIRKLHVMVMLVVAQVAKRIILNLHTTAFQAKHTMFVSVVGKQQPVLVRLRFQQQILLKSQLAVILVNV
jgi:hypothetical protein